MELTIIALFCGALLFCVAMDFSIVYALFTGLGLFWFYGFKKGFGIKQLGQMSFAGVWKVKNILITFMLIGMLTAIWRTAGTIPFIVCTATQFITPQIFIAMTFVLNCMVALLIGTSFGTAATMGVICVTMAHSMGINIVPVCGAMLSGTFFGDRCSPVSTSALLVAELTDTDIFDNIKNMAKSCAVPFVLAVAVYLAMGFVFTGVGEVPDLYALFGREFALRWITVIPAAIIIVLSLFKIRVKAAMITSIIVALPIAVMVQGVAAAELPGILFWGYTTADAQLAPMLNGGGVVSMLRVALIVCVSSAYSGIFEKTGLLDGIKHKIEAISRKATPFAATLAAAVGASAVACNQTLAIMLTHQLCDKIHSDKSTFALALEDTVVVTAALVPWSIASGAPLASVGGPVSAIPFACFLYILPLWRMVWDMAEKRKNKA
ncbi:MAG: sodium:proton antiporter [Oscillospiraceae bacterium]|nr:sodium:proton antiporter [Oscillospiraceae bacterium]